MPAGFLGYPAKQLATALAGAKVTTFARNGCLKQVSATFGCISLCRHENFRQSVQWSECDGMTCERCGEQGEKREQGCNLRPARDCGQRKTGLRKEKERHVFCLRSAFECGERSPPHKKTGAAVRNDALAALRRKHTRGMPTFQPRPCQKMPIASIYSTKARSESWAGHDAHGRWNLCTRLDWPHSCEEDVGQTGNWASWIWMEEADEQGTRAGATSGD
jgi:hypothetical protein